MMPPMNPWIWHLLITSGSTAAALLILALMLSIIPINDISLGTLPPACPELNSAENIWQYLRQTYLGNRVFDDYTAILDACQDAWQKLLAETGRDRKSVV